METFQPQLQVLREGDMVQWHSTEWHFLDIENAFSTGAYPKKLSYKLYLRKGLSLKELNKKQPAEEAFKHAETLLGAAGLEQEKMNEVNEIIIEAKQNIDKKISTDNKDEGGQFVFKETEIVEKVENPNISIPELRFDTAYRYNIS